MSSSQPTPRAAALAIILIIATGLILSGMDAIAKFLAWEIPVLIVIWGRYFFHTVLTFTIFTLRSRSVSFLKPRKPIFQFFRAAALFLATFSMYLAITRMQLGDATSIQFLAPVLLTALSGFVLGERIGPRRWGAVLMGFTGVLLVARPGSGILGWSALLPLITALMIAIYMLMTRMISGKDNPTSTTFYSTALGAAVLSLVVPFYWQSPDISQWVLMLSLGAAGALGHYLLIRAFFTANASTLAPFTYSQVVGAILWGFLIFGDIPSMWTFAGAALVCSSGIYVWYRETRLLGQEGSLK